MQLRSSQKNATLAGLALIAFLSSTPSARADIVTGLFNTGTDANNAVVNSSGSSPQDLHYTLTSSPAGAGNTYVVDSSSYPLGTNGPWIADNAAGTVGGSAWITGPNPTPFPEPNSPPPYDYRTTFNYSGTAGSSVSFAGSYSGDDQVQLSINGVTVTTFTTDQGYNKLYSFSFSTVLQSGSNTLDLLDNNTHGNSEGVRLQISATPEPSTIAMSLGAAGLFGLFGIARRRRSASV